MKPGITHYIVALLKEVFDGSLCLSLLLIAALWAVIMFMLPLFPYPVIK